MESCEQSSLMLEVWLLAISFAVGGGAATVWGMRGLWRGLRSLRWPKVPGVVKGVRILDGGVLVSYEYTVESQHFLGNRVRFGGPPIFETDSGAAHYASRFPIGGKIPVHYDPQAPEQAVLETGIAFGPLVAVVTGLPLLLVGVGVLVYGLG
jgi:hypothetical protein